MLKIIAERKIAHHFEKRMVAGSASDIFEIVMFSASADAALRGCGARVGAGVVAEKDIFELHHPGVGEEQRRIILRNKGGTGDNRMPALRKKF